MRFLQRRPWIKKLARLKNNETSGKKFLIILFENQSYDAVMNIPGDNYFKGFAAQGMLMTDYHGVAHPSQPNYIALTSGSVSRVDEIYPFVDHRHDIQGNADYFRYTVTGDDVYNCNKRNIVDLLEENQKTWKVYAENYPGNCNDIKKSEDGLYVRKHNPLISYDNVRNNPLRCQNIVDGKEFGTDMKSLPNFSMYIPNMQNDGHDTSLAFANQWFGWFYATYLVYALEDPDLIVCVTFDEDENSAFHQISRSMGISTDNHIYCAFVGKFVEKGSINATRSDHYSLLRTIEHLLQLPTVIPGITFDNFRDPLSLEVFSVTFYFHSVSNAGSLLDEKTRPATIIF